jgi:putative NADPH-quinone reductase
MRYLVVYAHPVGDSFVAALHRRVVKTLHDAGHTVDDCDLHAEGFQPAMSEAERRAYHDVGANRASIENDIQRLQACEGLVLVFPTWWYGMPAMLKGYIDRVWVPGVAFRLQGGRTLPLLHNIRRFAVVTTYGSPWWLNKLIGDPNRRTLMRGIRMLYAPSARTLWLAQYGMDDITAEQRERFLERVERKLRDF